MAAQIRKGGCRGARRCFRRGGLQGGGADPGRGAAGAAAQLMRGEGRRRRRGSTAGTDDAVGRIGCGGELWTGRGRGRRGKSARLSRTRLRCRVGEKRSSCVFRASQISGFPGKRKLI